MKPESPYRKVPMTLTQAKRRSAAWKRFPMGALMFAIAFGIQAQPATVRLRGNVSPLVARAALMDRVGPNERIQFSITLPVRNEAQLDTLLQRLYTPGDPLYRQYLKTGEFAERFGPTEADYAAVIGFVQQQGLEVAATHSNRLVLQVAGTSERVEAAFGIRMMRYRANSGRVLHAPDAEPAVPAAMAGRISGIVGLDDALEPQSNLLLPSGNGFAGSSGGIGSGPNQGLSPSDIKTAYNLNGLTETGAGQTIALFELDGYVASDIRTYETNFGLPNVTLQNVLLDNVSGTPSTNVNAVLEVTLDIELAMAVSPNVNKIMVYEGTSFVDIYNQIAGDNAAQQVSTSWYAGRDIDVSSSLTNGESVAFKQMASQGQTFYAASGDYGSQVRTGTSTNGNPILKFGVQDPSAQPFVTGVGGTTLATAGPGGAYQSETAWSGSGGGISTFWGLPNYQSSVVSPGSGGSASFRNLPDVSLCSDPNTPYAVYASISAGWTTVGGTSCAAPLWAGFTALINQRRANHGAGQLDFLNPTLYYLGNTGNYAVDFNDITNGNNGTYAAVSKFDNCTGWGSLNGGALMNDLQVNADVLYVDASFGGSPQSGTISNPYKTVTAAYNAASPSRPTLIYIRGGTYLENLTLNKNVLLINNGNGSVTIN